MCHHHDAYHWDYIGQSESGMEAIHYNDSSDAQNNQTQWRSTFPFIIPSQVWSGAHCGARASEIMSYLLHQSGLTVGDRLIAHSRPHQVLDTSTLSTLLLMLCENPQVIKMRLWLHIWACCSLMSPSGHTILWLFALRPQMQPCSICLMDCDIKFEWTYLTHSKQSRISIFTFLLFCLWLWSESSLVSSSSVIVSGCDHWRGSSPSSHSCGHGSSVSCPRTKHIFNNYLKTPITSILTNILLTLGILNFLGVMIDHVEIKSLSVI